MEELHRRDVQEKFKECRIRIPKSYNYVPCFLNCSYLSF